MFYNTCAKINIRICLEAQNDVENEKKVSYI